MPAPIAPPSVRQRITTWTLTAAIVVLTIVVVRHAWHNRPPDQAAFENRVKDRLSRVGGWGFTTTRIEKIGSIFGVTVVSQKMGQSVECRGHFYDGVPHSFSVAISSSQPGEDVYEIGGTRTTLSYNDDLTVQEKMMFETLPGNFEKGTQMTLSDDAARQRAMSIANELVLAVQDSLKQ